jgi:hypothetical protein
MALKPRTQTGGAFFFSHDGKVPAVHCFLAPAVVILSSAVAAGGELPDINIVTPLILYELVGIAAFFIACAIWKDRQKAALITSFNLVIFFCFGMFVDLVSNLPFQQEIPKLLLAVFFIGVMIVLSLVLAKEYDSEHNHLFKVVDRDRLTYLLNLTFALLLGVNATQLIWGVINASEHVQGSQSKTYATIDHLPVEKNVKKPDIYYLVFDGMPAPGTLKEYFDYDNSSLRNWLTTQGFYIADHSHSNYDRTVLSTSSALNFDYVNAMIECVNRGKCSKRVYLDLIDGNASKRLCERYGYRYVQLFGAEISDYLTPPIKSWRSIFTASLFNIKLLSLTPLPLMIKELYPFDSMIYAGYATDCIKCLPEVLKIPSPKFVHIHVTVFHLPWIFDARGNVVPLTDDSFKPLSGPLSLSGQSRIPLNSLNLEERMIKESVELVLKNSQEKPIIIVQGDHGPPIALTNPDAYAKVRTRVLNAYLCPPEIQKVLYPTITPINTFRVIFNGLFGTKFPLLPDRTFCAPSFGADTSQMRDVTDIVKY